MKRRMVQDNVHRGAWDYDILANEFDAMELVEIGLEIPEILAPNVMTEGEKLAREKQRNAEKAIFCVGMGTAWLKRDEKIEKVESLLKRDDADDIALYAIDCIIKQYG